jgi:hypothetical protein
MYTFEVTSNPPMCRILYNGKTIDYSGPWESEESAILWAEQYTDELNGSQNYQ